MNTLGEAAPGTTPFRVCFVCAGNICRSPMAASVFTDLVAGAGLEQFVDVSSAGTGDWHVGEHADQRTITALHQQGHDASAHRAKQFDPDRFRSYDLVVALDRSHDRILRAWADNDADHSKVHLLLSFDNSQTGTLDVPDPYYSDAQMFDTVLGMIDHACRALFHQLEPALTQGATP
ncbi:MAG TPA: low molecular weight protein-tyrosine-phosphatase [Plantibacter sp.]|uniref:low molecular weight protein-tyrosine-phosphatase n=1 Tax=unclassified Plantibacter TaxID=2624265 RepID=UPI002C5E0253|nr:low molecular weight protein-tyrosine-phosphatase [Plantibacter sp.]